MRNRLSVNGLVIRAWRAVAIGGLTAAVAACTSDRVLAAGRHFSVHVLSGDAQTAPAGSALPAPLTVLVRDAAGDPVKAAIVVYRVVGGSATGAAMDDSVAVTDANGRAQGVLRLGGQAGTVTVRVYPLGAADRGITMTARSTAGPSLSGVLPYVVGPGDTLSIAGSALGGTEASVQIGASLARPISGSTTLLRVIVPDCLDAGELEVRVRTGSAWTNAGRISYAPSRRPFALRPYEGAVIGAGALSSCLMLPTEEGAEYVLVPQFAARASSPVATMARVSAGGIGLQAVFGVDGERAVLRGLPLWSAQAALDAQLRDEERRIAPLARDRALSTPPMLAMTVGSRRAFWVQTTLDGGAFARVTGTLRWLGNHVGIYVDTAAASSYTDDELTALGRLFDRELYTTATTTFGAESDIDKNGRVLVFMTPTVNALVAAGDCGQRGFVTGFFSGRDLLTAT
ncbi:MAG: hypothetical protein H3C62_06555, partial [Gemmatimonadaceae bacterium]|nr:hypothetical protein [Gemmatimonadaceae bacterium]